MKVSQIGLISRKLTELDKQFPVQDMLCQTGQLESFASGIYAYGHIPYLVKQKIDNIIRKNLNKYGASEISLPLLQPQEIWKKSGRLKRYIDDGVMFTTENYCLAPTAEEAVVEFAKKRISSYKQMPVIYYQIGAKFRNELRARGFLLRGKAFDMMDAYSFDATEKDSLKSYEIMKKAYFDIFNEIGLSVMPVGADSGAIGGNHSEEFMHISDVGEDIVLYDEKTGKALNTELLEREDAKEYIKENYGIDDVANLKKIRTCELGHIFYLGDKYSSSMNGVFSDSESNIKSYAMGCYGIGVSRTLAMVYEDSIIKNEDGSFKGIVLPENLSPYKLYIIPKLDDEEKYNIALDIEKKLHENGVDVLFDDRQNVSIGAKIKDSLITGVPYVAVFGNTLNDGYVEIENNKTGEKENVKLEDFLTRWCK